STQTWEFGEIGVDLTRRIVSKQGVEVKLTRTEYNLLAYFLLHPGWVVTRDKILNSVWDMTAIPIRAPSICTSCGCGRSLSPIRASRDTSARCMELAIVLCLKNESSQSLQPLPSNLWLSPLPVNRDRRITSHRRTRASHS